MCGFHVCEPALKLVRMTKRNHLPARTAPLVGMLLGLALAVTRVTPAIAQSAPPAPAVTVVSVPVEDVAPVHSFIGRVVAIQSVNILPRVTAFIDNVPVKQGSDVHAGQVLFELQRAQYEATLKSAEAQLSSAQAALRQSQVAYTRAARLNQRGFESQANLDQATATRDQDQAKVESAEAAIARAQLDVSYCTITSPIDGRIGAVTLTKGNLVTPSTGALVTVNQLDPIRVVFSVADRVLVDVEQRTGATLREIADAIVVHLTMPGGTRYNHPGKISFLSNEVDPKTGTVSVYADFPNPDRLLLPGAFVNVEVRRATPEKRPLVPVAAVQTDKSGNYVLVVGTDNKVKQQPVKTGRQIGQDFIVDSGLSGGERVIVAGVQKVQPGQTVTATEAPQPPAAENTAASAGG
jgi:membrane fusion protein (multidrug efflux system)